MSHEPENGKLLQYFYAELSARESAEFERHLAGCEACSKKLKELQAVSESLSCLDMPEPAGPDLERIVARAQAAAAPPRQKFLRRPGWQPAWTFAAAIAAILAIVFSFWLTPSRPNDKTYELAQAPRDLEAIDGPLAAAVADDFFIEEGAELDEIQEELSALTPASRSEADELESMEYEMDEIEKTAGGIL